MDVLKDNLDTISIDTLMLEEIVQEERNKEISKLHSLSNKVCNIHISVLYYRNPNTDTGVACYEAWKMLVKKVGGTPNGWRDLGSSLGIKQDELDYIMNSVQDDPVDIVLKLYRLNEKATLDKITEAFIKMKRYDILKSMEEPFSNLCQHFKDDSGYQSNSENKGQKKIISFDNIPNDLPPALNKNYIETNNDRNRPNVPIPRPVTQVNMELKNDRPILFLTFTEDGLETAFNIQEYVNNWTDITGVNVITLSDRRDEVYQNPEKFIREYFEKADFIVPIVTSGYLREIRSSNPTISNTTDNLDFKYVNFIYSLIVSHYIHATGCLNKKVRTVLPQNVDGDVFMQISMYPDLMPWTFETKFDEQFKAFLKYEYS